MDTPTWGKCGFTAPQFTNNYPLWGPTGIFPGLHLLVTCLKFLFLVCLHVSCSECYSEASDHEEAETTEIPPPPYSEKTLRDSSNASGPPGSTHQVSNGSGWMHIHP